MVAAAARLAKREAWRGVTQTGITAWGSRSLIKEQKNGLRVPFATSDSSPTDDDAHGVDARLHRRLLLWVAHSVSEVSFCRVCTTSGQCGAL